MRKQWHPVFAQLLRPRVEGHFDVKTNLPVGDLPREADIVLLRRTSEGPLPFQGLWRNLRTWNVFEFKGPTVSPRRDDIDLLVEVGLGIHRRLNEEREREGGAVVGPGEVSFWYVVNHIGRRFLRDCQVHLGPLEEHEPGVWRCVVLGRVVFLVSGADVRVEEDTLPLHLIGKGTAETERAMAEFLAERPLLWQEYAGWLASLHNEAFQEVKAMAKAKREKFEINLSWLAEELEPSQLVEVLGKELGPAGVVMLLKSKKFLKQLPAETCRELSELFRRQAEGSNEPDSPE